jgi:hypothetical protein
MVELESSDGSDEVFYDKSRESRDYDINNQAHLNIEKVCIDVIKGSRETDMKAERAAIDPSITCHTRPSTISKGGKYFSPHDPQSS